jgi:threonine/homoserine/homoserine lactone efflux protein
MTLLFLGFFVSMKDIFGLLAQSTLIGFTAAATLGPIALLVIQRTLKDGWRIGMASGLGVALADGVYGLAGALGIAALTSLLVEHQAALRVVGGLALVYLGLKAAFTKLTPQPEAPHARPDPRTWLGATGSIFLLTLSNPMTILFFSAVFAGIGSQGAVLPGALTAGPGWFALGVFAGSFSWWVILSGVVSGLRARFRVDQLAWLNRISGLAIAAFGIWVLIQAVTAG